MFIHSTYTRNFDTHTVFVFNFEPLRNIGIKSNTIPNVHIAASIQSANTRQLLRFICVIACTLMFSLPHFGQVI